MGNVSQTVTGAGGEQPLVPKAVRTAMTIVIQTPDLKTAEDFAWSHVGKNNGYELVSARRVEELKGRGHGWEFRFHYRGLSFVGIN